MTGWRVQVDEQWRERGWSHAARDEGERPLAEAHGDPIVVDGRRVRRVASGGGWERTFASVPRLAYVSGDRLLLLTDSVEYHAWGFLGPALLLDLADGAVVAELRGSRGAPLGDGRFLLGLEGYDVFDTWAHDRDGAVMTTWRTYGHYVVDSGGVRVVECDRCAPSRSRVVRLLPDGLVEGGQRLVDGQVPAPVTLGDGTLVVLDGGVLRAVDRELRGTVLAELLPVGPRETWRFFGELALDGDRLAVTLVERTAEVPIEYTTHRWSLSVRQESGRMPGWTT